MEHPHTAVKAAQQHERPKHGVGAAQGCLSAASLTLQSKTRTKLCNGTCRTLRNEHCGRNTMVTDMSN